MDLTFPSAAVKMDSLSNIARVMNKALDSHIRENGLSELIAVPTGKAGALRFEFPKYDAKTIHFEDIDEKDIRKCFFAITVLSEFANVLASAADITRK